MKKSELTVSMSMLTYEELLTYKNNYEALVKNINECFDYNIFDLKNYISFDTNKALLLCKNFLPPRYQEKSIVKTE